MICDFNISMATVDDRVAANWGTTRSIRGYHTREVRTHSNNIPLVTSTLIAPRQQWTPSKNQHGMGMPFLGCKRSQTLSAYQIRRTQFQVFADEKGRFLWLKINAKKHILKSTRDRAYAHVIDKWALPIKMLHPITLGYLLARNQEIKTIWGVLPSMHEYPWVECARKSVFYNAHTTPQ